MKRFIGVTLLCLSLGVTPTIQAQDTTPNTTTRNMDDDTDDDKDWGLAGLLGLLGLLGLKRQRVVHEDRTRTTNTTRP